MLYNLFYQFRDVWIGFNVLKYITFRALASAVFGFVFSWYVIGKAKGILTSLQFLQVTRDEEDCPALSEWHKSKRTVPTMGGLFIILSLVLSWLLWVDWRSPFLWLGVYVLFHLGLVGLLDDTRKIISQSSRGLSKSAKLINQSIVGVVVGGYLYSQPWFPKTMHFPFFKDITLSLGVYFILWSVLVISATSNAVNLTDGMDGLAIGCVIMTALTYAVLSYVAGNVRIAQYLWVPYVRGAGELSVMCAGIFGVGLGYLWYNAYPAEIFMGDSGALALGGVLGMVALAVKQEWLLVIAGGIFVFEALSVILQVFSFRVFGRRIFKVAPLHHHYQVKGKHEVKVIVRFWIISGILAILALSTLKLR